MVCFGMVGCVASEVRSVGRPKSPESAGKSTGESSPMGDSTLISSAMMPNIPERMKRKSANPIPRNAGVFPLNPKSVMRAFSVAIMRMDIAMRTYSMMSWRVS